MKEPNPWRKERMASIVKYCYDPEFFSKSKFGNPK
jgi:hypothetical protein